MFKGQPKGLIAAALANMGERFGFYIMMAILTLFISAKFGLSETTTGYIYSAFYASIYLLALLGGVIADKTKNYKGTILFGLILMAVGYLFISIPTPTPVPNFGLYLTLTCLGLLVIALGNGLFKGNLQALVGQMYDNKEYSDKRDFGFQIFYMFINIGGFFAPFIAIGVRNWWLKVNNFDYNANLPELCHKYLTEGSNMNSESLARLQDYANAAMLDKTPVTDLSAFVNSYLDVFNRGFQYAFMAAIVAMVISLVVFLVNKNKFPDPARKAGAKGAEHKVTRDEIQMSAQEIKQRIYALFAVFGVVIFFWLSFHQNGYSLTYFARDYVDLSVININLGFTSIKGAEIFQSVNPFFVVTLTPFIMWLFGTLKRKRIEPSTPMKIAIGMGIAALAYIFLMIFSFVLPSKEALGSMSEAQISAIRVTPWIMVALYFILTVAELFISPLGLSFVSKVAPPHLQGLMQGAWLAATAVGNSLLFIGGILYTSVPIWACWLVFVGATASSMLVMLSMVKWLERVTLNASKA
jgi:proton-dependent oligopeptide transporter, POT family